jgi:sec-independent protein translocase protein TatA
MLPSVSGAVPLRPAVPEDVTISPTQIIIILAIVLLIFGAKRIPEIARSLGVGAREFREGVAGRGEEPNEVIEPPAKDGDPDRPA